MSFPSDRFTFVVTSYFSNIFNRIKQDCLRRIYIYIKKDRKFKNIT